MSDVQALVERAMAASTADACVVIADEQSEANLRFANNTLTTNGAMRSRSVTVVSSFSGADGERAGVVSRSVTTEAELLALVAASEAAAREAGPAGDASALVEPDGTTDPGWAADPATTSIDVLADFATALGRVLPQWRAADRRLYGFAEHQLTSTYLATSTGVRRRHDQPSGRLEINGKDAAGGSIWDGSSTRDFTDIDVERIAERLERKLGWAARRVDLPAGRYDTILPPSSVADLLVYAYLHGSARDAEDGRSPFSAPNGATRVGERLSPVPLELYSDPAEPGLETAPFEIVRASSGDQSVYDNGAPVGRTAWLRDGELTDLVRTRRHAADTGAAYRPYIDNLVLRTGGDTAPDLDAMVAGVERGLLLTSLWYIRVVDPRTFLVTGLTRDGVFLVEDGAVVGSVNNFRFNDSPIDLLRRVEQVGPTERTLSREWADWFRRAAMPPLRVSGFNMSTVSQAS